METSLAELERLLYGYNYQVFLRVYRVPFTPYASAEWYITQALGPSAVIGGVVPAAGSEIVIEVEQSLRYAGDADSGPEPLTLQSQQFEALVPALLSELERTIAGAELLGTILVARRSPGVSGILGLRIRRRGTIEWDRVRRQQF